MGAGYVDNMPVTYMKSLFGATTVIAVDGELLVARDQL
jgi:predicted acylesterase/phospholipase RssA